MHSNSSSATYFLTTGTAEEACLFYRTSQCHKYKRHHHHFSVDELGKKEQALGAPLRMELRFEAYFDRPDFLLARNNHWLKKDENDNWSLKVVSPGQFLKYDEHCDPAAIFQVLRKLGLEGSSLEDSQLKNFAHFYITRFVFCEKENHAVYIDLTEFPDGTTYNCGTVSFKKKAGTAIVKEALNQFHAINPTKSKLMEWISGNMQTLYDNLIDLGVVKKWQNLSASRFVREQNPLAYLEREHLERLYKENCVPFCKDEDDNDSEDDDEDYGAKSLSKEQLAKCIQIQHDFTPHIFEGGERFGITKV